MCSVSPDVVFLSACFVTSIRPCLRDECLAEVHAKNVFVCSHVCVFTSGWRGTTPQLKWLHQSQHVPSLGGLRSLVACHQQWQFLLSMCGLGGIKLLVFASRASATAFPEFEHKNTHAMLQGLRSFINRDNLVALVTIGEVGSTPPNAKVVLPPGVDTGKVPRLQDLGRRPRPSSKIARRGCHP